MDAKPIFISYRRSDAAGRVSHLAHLLETPYPGKIFVDVQGIDDGARWDREIRQQVENCQVLLVVIGPNWLKMPDPDSGMRLLDDPNDWVRREVETGLRNSGIRVIPVLVDGAEMPKQAHLPEPLRDLTSLEDRPIRHRDADNDIRLLVEQLAQTLGPPASPASRADVTLPSDTSAYLEKLAEETRYIDIKGIQVGQNEVKRLEIRQLYTTLQTLPPPDEHAPRSNERIPLQQALEQRRIVLVGDPGAGKSTFLRRLAFAACAGDSAFLDIKPTPFPILIETSNLSGFIDTASHSTEPRSPEWLLHYLEQRSRDMAWGLPKESFRAKLLEGCLLLVDALDEAPNETRRADLAGMLEKAAIAYPQSRIVLTTRPSAYGGETQVAGYRTVEIAPLDGEAIQAFCGKWYQAVYPGDLVMAEKRAVDLLETIQARPEIEEMALNPFMLTALAMLHHHGERLPDQRVKLYEAILLWLARTKHDKKNQRDPGRITAEVCLERMRQLAFTMHTAKRGMLREISPYSAAQALKDRFRSVRKEDRFGAAGRFLKDEEVDSGILVGRNAKLRFWHRTFQEYLAAKALSVRVEERQTRLFGQKGCLYHPDWRETILLLGGLLCEQDTGQIDAFLAQILDQAKGDDLVERARCVGLIGLILRDLKAWSYEIKDARYQEYLKGVLSLFEDPKAARAVDFQTRLEVADALGQVGDPRLAEEKKWVEVKGCGKVRWFGKYPVTVSEYAEFLARGNGMEPGEWKQQLRYPNRPVVNVDWQQASGYCQWAKGRLPTSAEWECAARCGRGAEIYPWGTQEPDNFKANYGDAGPSHVTPVGMYPEGATPSGIFDLAGNVWEWCQDWFNSEEKTKTLRGGAWYDYDGLLRVSDRSYNGPDERSDVIGFRCVWE